MYSSTSLIFRCVVITAAHDNSQIICQLMPASELSELSLPSRCVHAAAIVAAEVLPMDIDRWLVVGGTAIHIHLRCAETVRPCVVALSAIEWNPCSLYCVRLCVNSLSLTCDCGYLIFAVSGCKVMTLHCMCTLLLNNFLLIFLKCSAVVVHWY